MVSDADRRSLYDALAHSLGREPAATLMELLPPTGWGDLATRADLAVLGSELRGEMSDLRGELRGEMSDLRGQVGSLLPRLIAANIASMIGVAALVLAAARLA